jgi:hypothetical protein
MKWNEAVPYLEEVRNTTKPLDQDCQCSGRGSNRRPLEYKRIALPVYSAVQPVASRYTDFATAAPKSVIIYYLKLTP